MTVRDKIRALQAEIRGLGDPAAAAAGERTEAYIAALHEERATAARKLEQARDSGIDSVVVVDSSSPSGWGARERSFDEAKAELEQHVRDVDAELARATGGKAEV